MPGDSPLDSELADVVERLYGLPPEEFTAARDAAAKAAHDKAARAAVRSLRRPTASAHLVNLLVREQGDLLDRLLELGPALARATAEGSGDALRELGRQRRELVQAVTDGAVAGHEASAAVRLEVEQTLEAALADPAAGEAVRSGALVRPLAFAGFGGVDLSDAVADVVTGGRAARGARPAPRHRAPAAEPAGTGTSTPSGEPARVQRAEQEALEAAAALDDAVRAAETAQQRVQEAERAHAGADQERDHAQQRVDELERQLADARAALEEAGHRAHAAQRARDQAARAAGRALTRVREAQEAAEQARERLDALRRGGSVAPS